MIYLPSDIFPHISSPTVALSVRTVTSRGHGRSRHQFRVIYVDELKQRKRESTDDKEENKKKERKRKIDSECCAPIFFRWLLGGTLKNVRVLLEGLEPYDLPITSSNTLPLSLIENSWILGRSVDIILLYCLD